MMRVYDQEWVMVRERGATTSDASTIAHCERCGQGVRGPVWYSLRTKRLRCLTCLTLRDPVGALQPPPAKKGATS